MAKIPLVDTVYARVACVVCAVLMLAAISAHASAQDDASEAAPRFSLAASEARVLQVRWPEMQRALADARVPSSIGRSAAAQRIVVARDARVDRGEPVQRWPWLAGTSVGAFAGAGALLAVRLHDLANVEHAPSSTVESARRRAPWLNGGALALGALGAASLAGAIIDCMTLRSSRQADAWTFRIGMPQVTLKRRF